MSKQKIAILTDSGSDVPYDLVKELNKLDSKIKTKVSDNIYRGIKIIYKNKVYDFSLNEGNV